MAALLMCLLGYIFLLTTVASSNNNIKHALLPDEGACDPDTRPRVITGDFPATVNSPNYPENYPNNSLCEWLFTYDGDTGGNVFGTVFNAFAVENCIDCACDYVEFYDGEDDTAPLISRSCGNEPQPAASSGSSMFMRFVSDDSSEFSGFELDVNGVQAGCGPGKPQVIRDASGSISSQNYPNNYPNSEDCGWRFEAPEGVRIRLTIQDDLEIEDCCGCDSLEVFDGENNFATRLGLWYDEDDPPVLTSAGNTMYVEFITDFSITGGGFFATYEHVSE